MIATTQAHAHAIVAALFATAALAIATPASAQVDDHLQCFKVEDSRLFTGVVDLFGPQFGLTEHCRVRVKGRRLCAPVRKAVRTLAPGTPTVDLEGQSLTFDRICYKVRCNDEAIGPLEVTDQFGTRTVVAGRTRQICTPAVKGPPDLPPDPVDCGNGVLDPGEQCEQTSDCEAGQVCTACCGCADEGCPDLLTVVSRGGPDSASSEDFGRGGSGHNRDTLDGARIDLPLCCEGAGPSFCGSCEIRGVDPGASNCRCQNDNRAVCDQPFEADDDDCGGEVCQCYTAPPQPRSAGNVPRCVVTLLGEAPSGRWNVDSGTGNLDLERREITHLGELINDPCPSCVGDTAPGDGVRDGVCVHGLNEGLACDAHATEATFPAPGGGAYSYDCFPDPGLNVSGAGLRTPISLTTGTQELTKGVRCGLGDIVEATCHCGVCADDPAAACTSDGDCFPDGGSLCENANGTFPSVCEGECVDEGGNQGICNPPSPTDRFCDGVTRADGRGLIQCLSNADCGPLAIDQDAGNCTLTEPRRCFLDTVTSAGLASTTQPVLAGLACVPPTTNAGVNASRGLPGPVRLAQEVTMTPRCANDRDQTYPDCP